VLLIHNIILSAEITFKTLSVSYRACLVCRDLKKSVKGFNTCECVSPSSDCSVISIKQIKVKFDLNQRIFRHSKNSLLKKFSNNNYILFRNSRSFQVSYSLLFKFLLLLSWIFVGKTPINTAVLLLDSELAFIVFRYHSNATFHTFKQKITPWSRVLPERVECPMSSASQGFPRIL